MIEEIEELKKIALKTIEKFGEIELLKNTWQVTLYECEMLLQLFKENKMVWSDWAKMKELAKQMREIRAFEQKI